MPKIKERKTYQYLFNDRSILSMFFSELLLTLFHRVIFSVELTAASSCDSRTISLIVSGIAVSNAGAGGIPVGIAVARQRLQHQETSTSMRNVSLSHHTSHHATSYHHFQPDSLGKFFSPRYHSCEIFLDAWWMKSRALTLKHSSRRDVKSTFNKANIITL